MIRSFWEVIGLLRMQRDIIVVAYINHYIIFYLKKYSVLNDRNR